MKPGTTPLVATVESLWTQAAVLQRAGRGREAADLYRRFIALRPDVVEARVNLAAALADMGEYDESERAYRDALALQRNLPEAQFGLANVLRARGNLPDAAAGYRTVLARVPNHVGALYNLGCTLRAMDAPDQALAAFMRAVALKPDFPQAHNNLGILHYDRQDWEQAAAAFGLALRQQPDFFKARNNLGMALHKLGRHAEAEAAYREAIRLKPDYIECFDNLGALLLEAGRTEDAFACFRARAALVRGPAPQDGTRQRHDAEQAVYRGRAASGRVEIEGGGALAGPAVNPANNIDAIHEAWRTRRPQVVVIDDLLTPQALEALRRFCHGSTIWHDAFDGYVGARPQSGFACPLLAQIALEFAKSYPAIFRDHPLLFAWAFKYEQGKSGTSVHADFAAVNVNFWITPDDANLDPDTGGLVIWDKAAPPDWDFARYNTDQDTIREYLAHSGATAMRVPYRANRAVIFDSDLFHGTDVMSFRPGYDNRRINVTLLYGTREGGGDGFA